MFDPLSETAAALAALGLYRARIVPQVRAELGRWRETAASLSAPVAREQALASIDEKALNVEATAVFAVLAPRPKRVAATKAMVALQTAIDYLDTAEEQCHPGDPGYLEQLFATHEEALRALPSHATVATVLERAIARCSEGQSHTHAAEHGDPAALERWARGQAAPTAYRWWEVAAGAASSVAAHALIAAAADPVTSAAGAEAIDAAYFPAIGALTVLLDDLIDREDDAGAGAHSYLDHYRDEEEVAERLETIAALARARIAPLPHHRRHAAILSGVIGFYLSDEMAKTGFAAPIRERLLDSAGPAVRPIVAVMRRRRNRPSARPGG